MKRMKDAKKVKIMEMIDKGTIDLAKRYTVIECEGERFVFDAKKGHLFRTKSPRFLNKEPDFVCSESTTSSTPSEEPADKPSGSRIRIILGNDRFEVRFYEEFEHEVFSRVGTFLIKKGDIVLSKDELRELVENGEDVEIEILPINKPKAR